MINILLLMAGRDDAFNESGHAFPKNLIEIAGTPLVQHVIDGLGTVNRPENRLIAMIRKEENRRFHTGDVIRLLAPEARVLDVDQPTSGAACTALLAIELINTDEPLLILNGDQIIRADLQGVIESFVSNRLDGGITVFEAVHPRWSYVRCDSQGYVIEAAEKRPISNLATAGMYYFAKGSEFVRAAMEMVRKDAHVGGLFYICPVYNELVLRQARIGTHKIARTAYFSLANPQGVLDYEEALRRPDKD